MHWVQHFLVQHLLGLALCTVALGLVFRGSAFGLSLGLAWGLTLGLVLDSPPLAGLPLHFLKAFAWFSTQFRTWFCTGLSAWLVA